MEVAYFHGIEWEVAISWQLRGLCGCYRVQVPLSATQITLRGSYRTALCEGTVRAPVFGRYQFFGISEHYGKAHGSLLSWWMNYNYTGCCWFPTSSNILILPSQFWQIEFESYWLHCSKCWILVFLRYIVWPWPYLPERELHSVWQTFVRNSKLMCDKDNPIGIFVCSVTELSKW